MLLDTCTFLWLAAEDPCVPVRVRRSLETHAEPVYLSVVSMWEIAAKFALTAHYHRFRSPKPSTTLCAPLAETSLQNA